MDDRVIADRSVRRPNLDGVELPEADVTLVGTFAHDECEASDVDQSGAVGRGSLHHVVVSRSTFADTRLAELDLMDVSLRNVAVANASWSNVTARRVELLGCQAVGLNLEIEKADDLYVEDCRLDYARVSIEQRRGVVVFHRCTFVEAYLDGDLTNVVFSECDFRGAEFRARRAAGCDLTRSRLTGATGLLTLAGATITEDQAMSLSAQLATEAGLVISSAASSWADN
jgi:uncharacterized protein YjbI with pentapeptide repeats